MSYPSPALLGERSFLGAPSALLRVAGSISPRSAAERLLPVVVSIVVAAAAGGAEEAVTPDIPQTNVFVSLKTSGRELF